MKIRISDITQTLLSHSVDSVFYLDKQEGSLVEKNDQPITEGQRYLRLPTLAEVQTIAACWGYVEEIDDVDIRHELQLILNDNDDEHELSEFTEALYYHGLEEEWETYKEEHLQHILADWCEHHNVDYSN